MISNQWLVYFHEIMSTTSSPTWRRPCPPPSQSWWWRRWPGLCPASTRSGPPCDPLPSDLQRHKQESSVSGDLFPSAAFLIQGKTGWTCVIRLGQGSQLGQLESHRLAAFPGPTVNDSTTLPTQSKWRIEVLRYAPLNVLMSVFNLSSKKKNKHFSCSSFQKASAEIQS